MSEALRQRTSARRVLMILAGLLAAVLALQGIAALSPGGSSVLAQGTSTPTPGTGIIKLINPDTTTSNEISGKSDGRDTLYHLVAWVGNAPSDAVVEFKFEGTDSGREDTIRCENNAGSSFAVRVPPDTFECFWNLAGVAEAESGPTPGADAPSNGTLRAILYSNAREVSRDEELVAINNQDREDNSPAPDDFTVENQGNTVEITYPTNGGTVGFYTPPGGTRAAAVIDVSTSEGTRNVRVYYSKATPGSEPDYQPCSGSSGETKANSEDGVRCTLAEGDRPEHVTAIAAVAWDVNEEPVPNPQPAANPDAADGHRAFGYAQDPSLVTLDPQTHTATTGRCSTVISAVVFDHVNPARKIAGANMDVHASGPSDQLSFDDTDASADNSSASQPPDKGGHLNETGTNCEADPPAPTSGQMQGDHEVVGEGDIKHIESTTGTDDAGRFKFQLFSPADGGTQFTAWADEDGSDTFCSAEAHAFGSIGWNQGAPAPVGVPATETTCPSPGATGTPGATPTPTGTATPTPTGTATGTSSPGTDRTLTLSTNKARMPAGRKVTFSGQILSNDPSCTDNEFVQIRRRIHGTTEYTDLFGTQTDSEGRFSVERRSRKSASYIAIAPAHDNCAEETSSEVTVLVKVLISILPSDKNPQRGSTIRIKSAVKPQHDRTRLVLQRKKGRRWVREQVVRMNNRSRGNFFVEINFNRRTFRTMWPSQHEDHESNRSRAVTIRSR